MVVSGGKDNGTIVVIVVGGDTVIVYGVIVIGVGVNVIVEGNIGTGIVVVSGGIGVNWGKSLTQDKEHTANNIIAALISIRLYAIFLSPQSPSLLRPTIFIQ
jgi:hypothetical protein